MKTHTISIIKTNSPNIVKFESTQFLTQHQNFQFDSIDDTKNSDLAKQLFYLPFVKKVYISGNFVAIEKYSIVEWEEIEKEVATQIEDYLNSGKEAVINDVVTKKVPVTVYAESTPNPATMKFIANKKIVPSIYEFKNIDDAKVSPLAAKLFHFPFVKEIFMDKNYISITKYDMADWNEVVMELREEIRNFITEGNTIIDAAAVATTHTTENIEPEKTIDITTLDDISAKIVEILEEYIKPAVASDGGNIMFQSYNKETKEVNVVLQGACSGCPSATVTLKNGIETMLKDMIPGEINSVIAVNG